MRFPVFVPLLACYPLLFIASRNPGQVQLHEVMTAVVFALVCSVTLLALTRLITPSLRSAALVVLVAILIFFCFGMVHTHFELQFLDRIEKGDQGAGSTLARLDVYLSLASGAILLLALLVARLLPERAVSNVVSACNVATAALLVFVLPGIYSAMARTSGIAEPGAQSTLGDSALQEGSEPLPDIYYIILDGYARADVLQAHYGFDNDPFLTELRKRGFHVASSSAANYNWTFLSLSSSLNMDYVQELLPGQLDPAGSDRTLPYEAIRNNRLSRILRERGYRFVHLQSTWGATARNPYADEFLPCQSGVFQNEYYRAVAESSWLKVMASKASHDLAQCHLTNLRRLKELPESPGPRFVFVHFLPPHHPYLFDRDGNVLRNADITNQFEFQKRLWGRKDQYLDQLRFMNDQLLEVVGALQDRSRVQPIIAIQSDHGPQVLELGVSDGFYAARLRNLTVVSLPGVPGFSLPDDIEPVNLFRVILDARFGTDLPTLASRHYISEFATPYDFRPTESAN